MSGNQNVVHATPRPHARMQIESYPESGRITVIGTGDKLTTAGIAAILTTLGTYYAGLTAAQQAALTATVRITPYNVDAAIQGADAATVAASLTTNVRTSGNTTPDRP